MFLETHLCSEQLSDNTINSQVYTFPSYSVMSSVFVTDEYEMSSQFHNKRKCEYSFVICVKYMCIVLQ
jgi:hypothetical protein